MTSIETLLMIKEAHRMRTDLLRAEVRLTLQIKSIMRRMSSFALSNDHATVDAASPFSPQEPAPSAAKGRRSRDIGAVASISPKKSLFQKPKGQPTSDALAPIALEKPEADLSPDRSGHSAPAILCADGEIGQLPIANAKPKVPLAALPLIEARQVVHVAKLKPEREMRKLAKDVHVWPWVEAINGFGAIGLCQIIAEAGDLSNYPTISKLWKRMGLAVINGKAQRKVAGDAALEQGYSPWRRAVMAVIGDSMIKKQNRYREIYLARKAVEQVKAPELKPIHHHKRAMRYMEKKLLKDLWVEWCKQEVVREAA